MAIIYRTVIESTIDRDTKKIDTKEFSDLNEAKVSLLKAFNKESEELAPAAVRTDGTINDDPTGFKYVELGKDGTTFLGLELGEDTDIFYIEKVIGNYALLSLNSDIFDYPTDLIGQFETLEKAISVGSALINKVLNQDYATDEDFNESSQLVIFLVPTNDFVDYWDGCSWSFKVKDGKPIILKDK